jgi:Arc/MetJ family transcription regulator
MTRTNVVLDDEVVAQAKKVTGIKTVRHLLDHALKELLRHKNQRRLLKLRGKIDWEGDLSDLRQGRHF